MQQINWNELTHIKVSGSSMLPTLRNGEFLKFKKNGVISKDCIVVFELGGKVHIKFVKGIYGDSLSVFDNNLLLNNSFITNSVGIPYKLSKKRVGLVSGFEGEIPIDRFFVLGDVVNCSQDSTKFGLIPQENIKGVCVK